MEEMRVYVCGFLFDEDRRRVCLIKKTHFPEGLNWSSEPYNGVGGRAEVNEDVTKAMIREFHEETGTEVTSWEEFAILGNLSWAVYFFRAFDSYALARVHSTTEEEVAVYDLNALPACKRNTYYLLPLALDRDLVGSTRMRHRD